VAITSISTVRVRNLRGHELEAVYPDAPIREDAAKKEFTVGATGSGVCDFCASGVKPTEFFKADDVELEGTPMISGGDWAACETCAPLVKAGNREELVLRAVRNLEKKPLAKGMPKAAIVLGVRQMHALFWEARKK
jgi:hypothetical protein